jgi:hypothetical protein
MNLSDLRDRFADCLWDRSPAAMVRHSRRKSERSLTIYPCGYRIASGQRSGVPWREQKIAYGVANALASEGGVFRPFIGKAKNAFGNCCVAARFLVGMCRFARYAPH